MSVEDQLRQYASTLLDEIKGLKETVAVQEQQISSLSSVNRELVQAVNSQKEN
jgi:hypothetical protein